VPRVQLAAAAWRDLDELLDFLRVRSPAAARRVGLAITDKIDLLAQFPEIGRLVEAFTAAVFGETGSQPGAPHNGAAAQAGIHLHPQPAKA
jgi:plasmid stabilization system protein ParE